VSDRIDVVVNLLWLAPGRVGGSEQYLTRQLVGLPADAAFRVRLCCQPAFRRAHPQLAARYAVVAPPFDRDWRPARLLTEHTWLPVHSRHADVIHHGGGTVPLGLHIGPRVVLTVHDLQYRSMPQHFSPLRLRYLQAMMPRSVRRAAIVATPSEYVRRSVIDAFGADPARVMVVPHGVPPVALPSAAAIAAVRQRYGIGDRRYVVYPAITHPHKRHRLLVDMLADPTLDAELCLVAVGGAGTAEVPFREAIAAAGLESRLIRPGRVDDVERDALVAGAEALVFPSEYEGFGAPLVEAMALGVPVVCSDHAAITEVVADAAVVVEEPSGSAWARGLTEAIDRRSDLIAAGRARRQAFTGERSGAVLAEVYRLAAGSVAS
jgi:alpha-1,3-rhamnosyl/mannosyltransferase